MRPTTDRFASGIHQRTEIAAFDHDCPGGHGSACVPVEVRDEFGRILQMSADEFAEWLSSRSATPTDAPT